MSVTACSYSSFSSCSAFSSNPTQRNLRMSLACLERGLRSAAIILGQIGPQYQSDAQASQLVQRP